jgi:predicted DNA-binding protein
MNKKIIMPKQSKEAKRGMYVRLPQILYKSLKYRAVNEDRTVTELVTEAIESLLGERTRVEK